MCRAATWSCAPTRRPTSWRPAARSLISDHFGLDVPVVVRTREELAAVVELDPLAAVATNPKRYLVSFLDEAADAGAQERLAARAAAGEVVHVDGREIYAWLPEGVGRSKLWSALATPASPGDRHGSQLEHGHHLALDGLRVASGPCWSTSSSMCSAGCRCRATRWPSS